MQSSSLLSSYELKLLLLPSVPDFPELPARLFGLTNLFLYFLSCLH